jgi:hypothetical protein
METEKNQEEMMKELDAKIAELNKLKEELGQHGSDSAADEKIEAAEAETQAEENVAEEPDDETIELFDEPLKWWQGAIVLGIPAVLGFVGGILAGVGMGKKD